MISRISVPRIGGALCLLALVATSLPAQQANWTIDPGHSHVGFRVRHLMIATIRGHFEAFTGSLTIDRRDTTQSAVTVEIVATSVSSGNSRRDNVIRSEDFLAVAQHQQITFRSTRIERTSEGWRAIGDLTIRGAIRSVSLPFTLSVAPDRSMLAASGSLTINREDFGMTAVPAATVGREITIEFEIEARPATPAGAP